MMCIKNYKLDKKGVDQLAYLLYQSNNDYNLVNQLVSYFSLNELIETKNNGLVSNLLLCYISINDDNMINQIVEISENNNLELMKRDFLNLIKYYYQTNIDKSIGFFKYILNTDSIILPKDLNFIIKNNMIYLLPMINKMFIETNLDGYHLIDDTNLKLIFLEEHILNILKHQIEEILGHVVISHLEKFINNQSFKTIIDGGNVLHARNGTINTNSFDDLENMILTVKKKIGNTLLVIHRRHLKTCPNLIHILNNHKIKYYLTPYNKNDDIFILWFFLRLRSNPFIISNDKYRDHIFKLDTSKKNPNNNFNQFNHILHQQTIGYNIIDLALSPIPRYSRCIQIIGAKIYVPHVLGKFIELNINE